MKFQSETRTCTACGKAYTHEPLVLGEGGSDLLANVTTCPDCLADEEGREQRAERERKAKAAWEAAVPAEYRKTDTAHPDYRKHLAVHKMSMLWLRGEDIGQGERRLFLGLIGESGRCKTRIVSQVAKRVIWEGGSVLWVNSSRFQWACQNQFGENSREAGAWLGRFREADFLVFDDIGSLKSTEAVSDNLYALLEHRTAHCLPMLWTSNETLGEMLAGKGITEKARKRNLSRLGGFSNILEL